MKDYRCKWWTYINRHEERAVEEIEFFSANSDEEAVRRFKAFKAMKEAENADPVNNYDGCAVENRLVRIDQVEITTKIPVE